MQHTTIRYWDGVQAVQSLQDFSGTPAEAALQGLQANTAYRVQAVWMDGQTELAFSNIAGFRTLGEGAITLTLHNISRDNYSYRVHYLFSSTYTLANATLSTNGQTFQGVISGNAITFIVTGLTAGDAYLYNVTATDIYGFEGTATGTIQTTVVNQVNIYYASRTENSVTFDLAYLHDYTFCGGWIDVWNSTDDPSTDNPISSEVWFDGDTQVTATGLTYETEYKFRAGMTVEDGFGNQTTVYSPVVTATTADHDYSNDYFTIKNESQYASDVYLKANSMANWETIEFSTDNGTTWTQKTASRNADGLNGTLVGSLRIGGKMLIRHSGAFSANDYHKFIVTEDFSISGNATSLTEGAVTSNAVMPANAFCGLFEGGNKLLSASNLKFDGFSNVSENGCISMFAFCTSLTAAPSLPWNSVGDSSFSSMFYGCTALTVAPALPATVLGKSSYAYMFSGCTALTAAPNLNASVLNDYCYEFMFRDCTSLTATSKLPAKSLSVGCYSGMYQNCTALRKGVDLRHVTTVAKNALFYMYDNCKWLYEAYYPSVGYDGNFSNSWLRGVSRGLGSVYAKSSVAHLIPTDSVNGCPIGWLIQAT